MHGLFITGTDTGVGKTLVAAALVRLLRRQGRRVGVCKPVATGAHRAQGRWLSEDTVMLAEAAEMPVERVTPWVFQTPAAPPVAARQEGAVLRLCDFADAVRDASRDTDVVVVEGVGGLLCPLTGRETVADLLALLRLPAVIVARRSLGTLNHTLLTVEAAARRGLPVAGVVISETAPPASLADESNVEELRCRLSVPVLAIVPYQSEGALSPVEALADVDWWGLVPRQPSRDGGLR